MASVDRQDGDGWVGVIDPDSLLAASSAKIAAPFELDPTLRFYSPQDNVDAFEHPRVAAHLRWLLDDWSPAHAPRRIAVLLPCTASKPYPISVEHRTVNAALLASGWRPATNCGDPPRRLLDQLTAGEDPRLLHTGALERDGVVLDRIVVSEPLALVPYERVYEPGCPATAYDDPGLFEWRATSVAPWRDDCTAVATGDGTWSWGPVEHAAYAATHNALTHVMAQVLGRVAPAYEGLLAWLPAGMTHRSFLGDDASRRAEGLPVDPVGPNGEVTLIGVGDLAPGLVELLPATGDPAALLARLDALASDRS